ncbi:ABC transporter permease [Lentzea flaviverrucosa]|uniref:Putative ABC transport system permease protein n=1 Tax=Lentzea flaviverrucosa TaxID=200379 RepID=A0A1H9D336_9PSEU|nr:FtsX-like permease family protein [Lentzea flaviverrucosa]RDI24729.1 putative ABC transport system permease protein [Lentzea flaviverrucosa]SEQ07767.1 putative ABC transport system permease protein [Lentzea flaviverrucosa]
MSAVWSAAWAAVLRRKLQTIVIAVVVCAASATLVMALGLLDAAAAPFDRAFGTQQGAHLAAQYDADKATGFTNPAAQATAGPFRQATVDTSEGEVFLGALTVVGRADPGGQVDRLAVSQGRWATGSGEIVLNRTPGADGRIGLGFRVELPGRPALTVVGFAHSVTGSADAWVTPEQVEALRPDSLQVLYRFAHAGTAAEMAAATAGLPREGLLGTLSHLTVKDKATSELGVFIPFLMIFGILGLAVAVLIVANVVSGAVVAGLRHIGMLKAIGFTPNQVMAVYLVMVSAPAVVGCALGTVAGNFFARPVVQDAVEGFGVDELSFAPWVNLVAALGMPLLVVSAALVPALRARGLPAARAISAGTAAHTGRAMGVQRWLGGTGLPRSISLGLGMPFARTARSALTLASVVLGVMTVTLAAGVTMSMTAYNDAVRPHFTDRVELMAGPPPGAPAVRPEGVEEPAATLGDAEDESMLRSLPGTTAVLAETQLDAEVAGGTQRATILFYRGDVSALGPRVLTGHWPDGPGQVAVPSRFLNQRGLAVGDTITVRARGNRTQVKIVGVVLTNNADEIFADWSTVDVLDPGARATTYLVQMAAGTDRDTYAAAVKAADPGLRVLPPRDGTSSTAVIIISAAVVLTLVLGAVAALGVFNTVVLNARERRRDLGMLKSIGMTPRQVTVLLVTSMGALGVLGGLIGVPIGIAVHQVVVPLMAHAGQADAVDILMDVYHAPLLALLALTGVVIAVLGAVVPARGAARLSIATVLHNE